MALQFEMYTRQILLTTKLIALINFGLAIRYPVTVQSCNHSYFIQTFKYFVFHLTILKLQGHGAIFICDCNNLLKTYFCCCRTRKLPHVPKLYSGDFYRVFKKSNNYVAAMLISVILMPFELWLWWSIQEQYGVFYRVK